jgi:hypothetical protein
MIADPPSLLPTYDHVVPSGFLSTLIMSVLDDLLQCLRDFEPLVSSGLVIPISYELFGQVPFCWIWALFEYKILLLVKIEFQFKRRFFGLFKFVDIKTKVSQMFGQFWVINRIICNVRIYIGIAIRNSSQLD